MPFVGCCALVYFWTLRFSRIGDFYTLRLGFFGNLDLRIISRRFFIRLSHERFHEKIVAFLFAVIFGLTSAIFLSAGADNELVRPQDPSYPYSLIDVRAQSLPMQSFTAIIPVERGLCVNVSRFPSSPITGKVGENIAFLYEQQLYCQLVDLWEKVVEDCYDKYKAQLCYDGHYLYSLCKMLI